MPSDVSEANGPSRLAELLVEKGSLSDGGWREAFATVPRHLFLPDVALLPEPPEHPDMRLLDGRSAEQHQEWLDAIYSDQTLITQIDGRPVAEAFSGDQLPKPGSWTSSSTVPGLMAELLQALDVGPGMRVLEIGTGSGYNASIMCHRLGDRSVTTVDVDPLLTEAARRSLARLGYYPTVGTGDGAEGWPANAPYDRLIATVSWPWLPPAWIEQVRPGGLIVANVLGQLGGAVVAARVDRSGVAQGRFIPCWIGFMAARNVLPSMRSITALSTDDGEYESTTTRVDPTILHDRTMGLLAHVATGDAQPYWSEDEAGRQLTGLLAPDGSWAEIYQDNDQANGERQVDQGGPRSLWTLVQEAFLFWEAEGRPDWTHFGLTASRTHQEVWYESRDSPHKWTLPAEGSQR